MRSGMFKRIVALVATVMVGLVAVPASADFQLVETFNGLTTGGINGQNGWTAPDALWDVTSSAPASTLNKALSNGDGGACYRSVPTIANGSTGTLFFRFYNNTSNPNTGMGLADATTGDWGSFRAYIIVDAGGVFKARDAGGFANIDNVTLALDTWYKVWIVADNNANTYEAYIQGGAITTQTQLMSGGTGTFGFRNTETGWDTTDIESFQAPVGGGGSGDDAVVIDDIHVDNTGENLAQPTFSAEIYNQDFNNDSGSDAGLSTVGWTALGNLDSTGLNADASDEAISAGISHSADYGFFAPHLGILDSGLFLAYTTDSSVNVDISRVQGVSYSYVGDPVDAVYRVAVEVGGAWYAETTGTADTRSNPGAGGTFLSATFAPASFVAGANWVTVQNASVGAAPMTLGAAPGGDLSGTVTAIGLLLDGGAGVGDHVRFDDFAVMAAPIDTPTVQLSSETVSENVTNGTVVGVLSMAAVESWTAPITYSFHGGTDDASFDIDGTDLVTARVFDKETEDTYTIDIRATDSAGTPNTTNQEFTITIDDVSEPGGAMFARGEVQIGTTLVGTLEALPGSGDATVTYGVNAAPYHGGMFEISGAGSDELHLKATPVAGALNDEYFVEVTAQGNVSGAFPPMLLKVTVVGEVSRGTIFVFK